MGEFTAEDLFFHGYYVESDDAELWIGNVKPSVPLAYVSMPHIVAFRSFFSQNILFPGRSSKCSAELSVVGSVLCMLPDHKVWSIKDVQSIQSDS